MGTKQHRRPTRSRHHTSEVPTAVERSIPEQVAAALAVRIRQGAVRPGDRLALRPIMSEYGIASSTAREALRILLAERLVRHAPNRGTFVTERGSHAPGTS